MTKDSYQKLDLTHELHDLVLLRTALMRPNHPMATPNHNQQQLLRLPEQVATLARLTHFALRKIADSNANPARLEIIVNEDDPGLDEDIEPRPTTTKVLTVAEYRLATTIAQLQMIAPNEGTGYEELTSAIEALRSAHQWICGIITDRDE